MKKNCSISIDYGGTMTKILIIDDNGKIIDNESFETPVIDKDEIKEINLSILWNNIKSKIDYIIDKYKDIYNFLGICCVGHGKGLYILGENDEILINGILSSDTRALSFLNLKKENIDLENFGASHMPILLSFLKENNNEIYNKIKYIFSAKDYIRYMLTGEYYTDYTDASSNNMLDLISKKYDKELLRKLDILEIENKLPELKNYFDKGGKYRDIDVYIGMFDVDACILGSGVRDEGILSIIAGTWSINALVKNNIKYDSDKRIKKSIFYDKTKYLIEASSPTSAGNINRIISLFFKDKKEKSIFESFEKYLNETDILKSQVYFTPFLYGNIYGDYSKSSIIGINSSYDIKDIVRAVYEGVVYNHKLHIEDLLKYDNKINKIRISGGVTNSILYIQMFSDILNYKIEVIENKELGALGGAISIMYGSNKYGELESIFEKMIKIKYLINPNFENNIKYEKKYKVYKKIVNNLDNIWESIKEIEE